MADKTIYAYEHWSSADPVRIGVLESQFYRGRETFSFTYDDAWLRGGPRGYMLDPAMPYYAGRQYPQNGTGLLQNSLPRMVQIQSMTCGSCGRVLCSAWRSPIRTTICGTMGLS